MPKIALEVDTDAKTASFMVNDKPLENVTYCEVYKKSCSNSNDSEYDFTIRTEAKNGDYGDITEYRWFVSSSEESVSMVQSARTQELTTQLGSVAGKLPDIAALAKTNENRR